MPNLIKECDTVFEKIQGAKYITGLKSYYPQFLEKYFLSTTKYPQINFTISKEEINKLGEQNTTLSSQMSRKDLSGLEKLTLSMLCKNGDLGKEKHIIEGILNKNVLKEKTSGHFFYQFGERPNNPDKEPIINQRIIGAYIFQKKSPEKALKINYLEKRQITEIKQYVEWARLQATRIEGKKEQILYEIDRVVLAFGRYIKKTNQKLST